MGLLGWLKGDHLVERSDRPGAAPGPAATVAPYVGAIRAGSLAASELATGLLSRALAGVTVEGPPNRTQALTPRILDMSARGMVNRGEAMYLVGMRGRSPVLLPAYGVVTVGGADPESWRYQLDLSAVNGSEHRVVGRDQVMHLQWSADPLSPWHGVSPFDHTAAKIAALIERGLVQETSQPSGSLLPVEVDPPFGLPGSAGRTAVGHSPHNVEDELETVEQAVRSLMDPLRSGGFAAWPMRTPTGTGPNQRGVAARFGADPPQFLVMLMQTIFEQCVAACGIPRALVFGSDGAAARAGQAHYQASVVVPILRHISEEASRALDADIRLRPGVIRSPADLRERSLVVKNLVAAGVGSAEAMTVADL